MSEPLLMLEDVSLRFGGVTALAGVSLDVQPGELRALIGPNGAGKTSIFNCLSGFYRPQAGSIRLDGRELIRLSGSRIASLGVSRTFQNLGLFANLGLVENLMLGRHHLMRTGFLSGMAWWGRARREEIAHREAVERVIDLLELEPYRDEPADLLPYGVQKRVELGRALAMEPRLLLLDEPVAGMNARETARMTRCLQEVRRVGDVTMILVEHDMEMVMGLADRITVLDFGVCIATGTPSEVRSDPKVLAAYLGAPTAQLDQLETQLHHEEEVTA
jgi:branched-chain amino acid transport system ATP-binding protein